MITIFDRCEVFLSLSVEKAMQMRYKIEQGGIKCQLKCEILIVEMKEEQRFL